MQIARRRLLFGRSAVPNPAFDCAAFEAKATPWTLVATIGAGCIARKGVVCQSCADACEVRAIRFRPAPGSVPAPRLDASACSGCGACVSVCPVNAIGVAAGESNAPRVAKGAGAGNLASAATAS
jgi:ferredoxin